MVMSVCPFHDCSDHIWQVQQTHKCDTSSETIFRHEFNDVGFMIRVTIYGKYSKHTSVIHLREPFFDVNSMVIRFCDQSDHIWQVQQTHKGDTSSGTIFRCEFNGDVGFVIRATIYGKSSKQTSVIHLQEPFFSVNSMVMSVS